MSKTVQVRLFLAGGVGTCPLEPGPLLESIAARLRDGVALQIPYRNPAGAIKHATLDSSTVEIIGDGAATRIVAKASVDEDDLSDLPAELERVSGWDVVEPELGLRSEPE
jgi:hypothetical protein